MFELRRFKRRKKERKGSGKKKERELEQLGSTEEPASEEEFFEEG